MELRQLSVGLLACLLLLASVGQSAARAEDVRDESGTVSIAAPADLSVTVNGEALDPQDAVSASPGILAGFESYTGEAGYETLLYRVEDLPAEAAVTVQEEDGRALEALTTDSKLLHFFHSDPAAAEELRPVAEKFFETYLAYACSHFDLTRLYNVLKLTLSSSELYRYLNDSQPAMIWAAHTTWTLSGSTTATSPMWASIALSARWTMP